MKENYIGTKTQGQPKKGPRNMVQKSVEGKGQLPTAKRAKKQWLQWAENTLRMRPACGKKITLRLPERNAANPKQSRPRSRKKIHNAAIN